MYKPTLQNLRPDFKALGLGILGGITTQLVAVAIYAMLVANILGPDQLDSFWGSNGGDAAHALTLFVAYFAGGFITARKAKFNKLETAAYIGILAIVVRLILWNHRPWLAIIPIGTALPLALLGGTIALKQTSRLLATTSIIFVTLSLVLAYKTMTSQLDSHPLNDSLPHSALQYQENRRTAGQDTP